MSMIAFFTSLISFGLGWFEKALYTACLFFEGIAYMLVSYCFKIFQILCTLNYNSLYGIAAPLLDRLQAVVIVLIVFKLGYSLIQYLLKPEDAAKEGSKILVNIFITAALLISYSFIFTVFNELSMLIMGNPTGYEYSVLGQIAEVTSEKDEGLIMRFIFGKDDVEDVGNYLSYSTITIFLHDYNNPGSTQYVDDIIYTSSDKIDFMKLPDLASRVKTKLDYTPVLPFIVALYLIYSLVKAAIAIGIRMFKLLILQILAPIAIISIISGGIKSDVFQKFVKKYTQVFLEAFTRMASMLIIVVFVCKFFLNINDFFPALEENWFTTALVQVIIIVAAFKFAGDIPKFIQEILGDKFAADEKGGGFGHFIGGLVGGGIGLASGLATGTAAGAISGLAGGISSGSKSKNIADFFKGQSSNGANARNVGANARMAGGSLAYAGAKIDGFFGKPQRQLEQGKLAGERQTAMDNMIKTLEDNYDENINVGGQEIGLSRDMFRDYAYDHENNDYGFYDSLTNDTKTAVNSAHTAYNEFTKAQGEYDRLRAEASQPGTNISDEDLQKAYKEVEKSRTKYQNLKSSADKKLDTEFNTRMIKNAKEGKNIKDRGRDAVRSSIETYDNVASSGYSTGDIANGHTTTKKASDHYTEQQDRANNSRTATRWNNSNTRGGSGS